MKRRSGEAQAAQHRKAGPMKHRLKARGGSKNDQPELLAQAEPVLTSECGHPGAEVRNCPYQADVGGDPDQRCKCCDDCESNCAADI